MAEVSSKSLMIMKFIMCFVVAWQILNLWEPIKVLFMVPMTRACLYISWGISFFLCVEWIFMVGLAIFVRIFGKEPEKRYKWEPIKNDPEMGSGAFPMVLVQIPIYNESEVCKICIAAACNLSWPNDRLVIQVLDDSTDQSIKDMVGKECMRWASEGINIIHQTRNSREGYKAGALKDGLNHEYAKECEYLAIFDADFRPEPDFLTRAIPFLMHNADLALIQARWRFVNADECLLTRMQEILLDYQFRVEEEGGSSTFSFISFNGSGGIWRISAINEAGGWKDRTTVEDLDLSVRAGLSGWNFLYLGDLQVESELPSTFKAYHCQQHRWACGPAHLFKKIVVEVVKNKEISLWRKFHVMYSFIFMRRIAANVFIFFFYCLLLPLTTFTSEINVRRWQAVLGSCIVSIINVAISTPRSIHLFFPWILFENMMSFHRTKSIFMGLMESKRANEWIVTAKFGDSLNNKSNKHSVFKGVGNRILLQELGMAVFLFTCGCYNFFYGEDRYFIHLFLQSIFFTTAGLGCFGTIVSNS